MLRADAAPHPRDLPRIKSGVDPLSPFPACGDRGLTTPINARKRLRFLDYATSCIVAPPSARPGCLASVQTGRRGCGLRADGGLPLGRRRHPIGPAGWRDAPLHGDRVSPEPEATGPGKAVATAAADRNRAALQTLISAARKVDPCPAMIPYLRQPTPLRGAGRLARLPYLRAGSQVALT